MKSQTFIQRSFWLPVFISLLSCGGTYSDVERSMRMEDYRAARRQLEANPSKNAKGWALLAECSYHEEDYPRLIEASKNSLKISDEFRSKLEYLLQKTYIELLDRAVTSFATQDNKTTITLLDHILAVGAALYPEVNPQIKNLEDEVLLLAGATCLRMEDYQRARGYYERAKTLRGEDLVVDERLALTYFYLGERQLCLKICDDVLKQQSSNANALKMRAQLIDAIGSKEEALNAYRDVLDFNYSESALHWNIGVILFELEDWSRARQHFENVYNSGQRNSPDLLTLIAECFYNEGRYSSALEKFEQAAGFSPENADLKRYIGACYWNLGKIQSAKEVFTQVDKTVPETIKALSDSLKTGGESDQKGEDNE